MVKTFAIDFYAGMIPATRLARLAWTGIPPLKVVEGSKAYDITPGDITEITALEGAISSFPLLHVDTWLSLNKAAGKGDYGIFGMMKTGNQAAAALSHQIGSPGLTMKPIDFLVLNYWSHNMNRIAYDFHVGYVIYYQ